MAGMTLRKLLPGLLLLMAALAVQAGESLEAPIPVDSQVRFGKLDNGLTYYIRKNSRPAKHVELRLVVKAGSILEDDDQQGLAHFTEHLAFDGTRHFKKHELISYLQSIGVKFGADLNAYTSFDETVYILPIPTDKPENLDTGFLVLEDWAQGVSMEGEAIEQERNVVLEEARMGKGADDRMRRKLLPEVFNGSRYAKRLPIGKEDILRHFSHDAIRRFYADWYRPDLMAVIVVGDIEPEQAEKMVRAHFTQLKNPPRERPRTYAQIPARKRSAELVVTDKEATMNVVRIGYPARSRHPEVTLGDYRTSMIRQLFVSMLGQRLQELAQQENPPFIGAYSGEEDLTPAYRSYTTSIYLGRPGAGPAIDAVVQENERARQYGFSEEELEQAKKRLHRGYEQAYLEREKSESAGYVREYVGNFLEQEPIPGIEREYGYAVEMLPGITLDEMNRYVRETIPARANKLVAFLGTSLNKEAIPGRGQLLKRVNAAEAVQPTPRVEKKVAVSLLAQPPKAGSIVSEKQNNALGTVELVLSNGLKVVLKPTDFKNDQVMLAASRFGGSSLYGLNDLYNARYSGAVVYAMGLGEFTPMDLSKVMAGKAATLYVSSDGLTDNINGVSGGGDIEAMFQLLHLRMTAPRRDEALFRAYVSKSQDMAKDALSDPEAQFSDMVITTLYNNHPRIAHVPKPGDFGRISLDRAMTIDHERYGSAKGFTFFLVGSFDVEKIKPLIATYLASLPVGELPVHFNDLGVRPVRGVVKKEMRMGMEPKSRVLLIFTGPASYSREESRRMQMLVEIMNNRIIEVLRQRLSLIYSGGMRGAIERIPYVNYRINANLPCGPENVEKVIAAMFAEIEKIKKEGPQQAELDKVRQAWLEEHRIAMRTNAQWLSFMKEAALYGTDPAEILTEEELVKSITVTDIRGAANRYLNSENYLQAVLYPEKTAKAAAPAR